MQQREYYSKRIAWMTKTPYEKINCAKNLTDANREKIRKFKNIHAGERCFIIGSSPSLNNLDLTKLNNEHTFTVNRSYKLAEKGLQHSTYHLMLDIYTFIDDNVHDEIPSDFANTYIVYGGIDFPTHINNVIYIDIVDDFATYKTFCEDLCRPICKGFFVIYYALVATYYMGFKEIYLIGVDLDFATNKGHVYVETDGEKIRQEQSSIHTAPVMLEHIEIASAFLKKHDVHLYNASPSGIVNCIPRVLYDSLF